MSEQHDWDADLRQFWQNWSNTALREIGRLTARVTDLEAALRPFAEYADQLKDLGEACPLGPMTSWPPYKPPNVLHCRTARKVLEGKP